MKNRFSTKRFFSWMLIIGLLSIPFLASARETAQQWELINPEGMVKIEPMKVNAHPSSLEGKTVMLRWNGKHNGDNFLNRLGELLAKEVKGIKLIKSWEVAPETVGTSSTQETSQAWTKKLSTFKPDLVIASQCD